MNLHCVILRVKVTVSFIGPDAEAIGFHAGAGPAVCAALGTCVQLQGRSADLSCS